MEKTIGAEEQTGPLEDIEEPMFGVLDVVLLVALLGVAAWWLMRNKKADAALREKTYAIQ